MAVTKEEVVEFIANMTVLELSEFIKELEEKFGVSAAAVMARQAKNVSQRDFRDFHHGTLYIVPRCCRPRRTGFFFRCRLPCPSTAPSSAPATTASVIPRP